MSGSKKLDPFQEEVQSQNLGLEKSGSRYEINQDPNISRPSS